MKDGWSLDWLSGLLTFKPNHRTLTVSAMFRLHPNYVNSIIFINYFILLHNHCLDGIAGDDLITTFRQWPIIEGLIHKSIPEIY